MILYLLFDQLGNKQFHTSTRTRLPDSDNNDAASDAASNASTDPETPSSTTAEELADRFENDEQGLRNHLANKHNEISNRYIADTFETSRDTSLTQEEKNNYQEGIELQRDYKANALADKMENVTDILEQRRANSNNNPSSSTNNNSPSPSDSDSDSDSSSNDKPENNSDQNPTDSSNINTQNKRPRDESPDNSNPKRTKEEGGSPLDYVIDKEAEEPASFIDEAD